MKFSDIIGQDEAKAMMRRGADEGRVGHAQLLAGRSGAGVLPLALAYVQYLNCSSPRDGDSCGVCPSCVKIQALAHPDLHFVFPTNAPKGSGGSRKPTSDEFIKEWRRIVETTGGYFDEQAWYDEVGMENQQGIIAKREAEEVIRKLSFKSFEGGWKAVVIWLPERMGDEAANSLLKILEEPWQGTLFLLVSEHPERLLPTILSRTQQTAVPLIDGSALERYAVRGGLSEREAADAARLAGGDLLELRRIMSSREGEDTREYFDLFAQLMRFSFNDRHLELLEWAEGVASMGREAQKRFLEYSTGMLRESYVISAGMENISYLWGGERDFCLKFAPYIGNHNIESLVEENRTALSHVWQNGNAKIIFTHYALSVSKLIGRV